MSAQYLAQLLAAIAAVLTAAGAFLHSVQTRKQVRQHQHKTEHHDVKSPTGRTRPAPQLWASDDSPNGR